MSASVLTAVPLAAVAFAGLALVLAALALAAARHRRARAAVPLRIHVAGTRGKSTTTRLIARGLRAAGHRVLAKTTGTVPRLILPDGSERDWPRLGVASIREQARVLRLARRISADAVVLECMAIRPELVFASERFLIRAHVALITNARPDHLEELGAEHAVAASLAMAVPSGGELFVGDEVATGEIDARAQRLGTRVHRLPVAHLAPEAANRRFAEAVLRHLGAPELAVAALADERGDPGAFRVYNVAVDGRELRVACAFACNDAASLARLWTEHAADAGPPAVVLMNARADRPQRSLTLLRFVAARRPRPRLVLAGEGILWLWRMARRAGFARAELGVLRGREPEAALRALAGLAAPGATIWGIGNYRGLGATLSARLAARGAAC